MDKGAYLRDKWNFLDFFILIASIIDMFLLNSTIPALKVFKLFHSLRPLRFVTHSNTMKIVVVALLNSVSSLVDAGLIIFVIWYMFSALGMSLLAKRMQFCESFNFYGINKVDCMAMGKKWHVYYPNFDNIF